MILPQPIVRRITKKLRTIMESFEFICAIATLAAFIVILVNDIVADPATHKLATFAFIVFFFFAMKLLEVQ
jgi:hypothetical protein